MKKKIFTSALLTLLVSNPASSLEFGGLVGTNSTYGLYTRGDSVGFKVFKTNIQGVNNTYGRDGTVNTHEYSHNYGFIIDRTLFKPKSYNINAGLGYIGDLEGQIEVTKNFPNVNVGLGYFSNNTVYTLMTYKF